MKNITFAIGLGWLIWGGLTGEYLDWDVPVSLIMAGCTYISADWVVGVLRRREYRQWFKAAFLTWFSVAGSYNAYWIAQGHADWIVPGQWETSLCLYLLSGVIWSCAPSYQEALALFQQVKARISSRSES